MLLQLDWHEVLLHPISHPIKDLFKDIVKSFCSSEDLEDGLEQDGTLGVVDSLAW